MSDVVRASDGIQIRFDSTGIGTRALVFVHGWSCDRGYWKAQLPAFADRFQVATLDLAGHGESGSGRAAYTMEAFGADVAAVIDRLDLADAVLIGHSMGADVILETALLRPERVRGMVWVDQYGTLGKPRTEDEVRAFVDSFHPDFVARTQRLVRGFFPPTADAGLVDWIVGDMSSAPPEIAIDAFEHTIANHGHVLQVLPHVSAPVVAINTDFRPVDAEALRQHGVADVVVMPGLGHFPMMEDPERFNRTLAEVVDGLGVEA